MTQVLMNGTNPLNAVTLDANFTELYNGLAAFNSFAASLNVHTSVISGNTTVTTTIPVPDAPSVSGGGGGLVILRGADGSSGVAEARLYLVSARVSGGATPDVASTLIASTGVGAVGFTFAASGGFMTITSTGTSGGAFTMLAIGL